MIFKIQGGLYGLFRGWHFDRKLRYMIKRKYFGAWVIGYSHGLDIVVDEFNHTNRIIYMGDIGYVDLDMVKSIKILHVQKKSNE